MDLLLIGGVSGSGKNVALGALEDSGYYAVNNLPMPLVEALPALQRVAKLKEIPLVTGSEDFAFYAREVPSLFFFVGVVPAGQAPATAASNHSPRFFLDEGALAVGRRALTAVALDYLNSAPVRE